MYNTKWINFEKFKYERLIKKQIKQTKRSINETSFRKNHEKILCKIRANCKKMLIDADWQSEVRDSWVSVSVITSLVLFIVLLLLF